MKFDQRFSNICRRHMKIFLCYLNKSLKVIDIGPKLEPLFKLFKLFELKTSGCELIFINKRIHMPLTTEIHLNQHKQITGWLLPVAVLHLAF